LPYARKPRPKDFHRPDGRALPEDAREGLWTRDRLKKMDSAFTSALSREVRSAGGEAIPDRGGSQPQGKRASNSVKC